MQAFTDSGYPKNLSYLCKHLVGFSRINYKLQSLNVNTASNGNVICVDLPSNSLVDLKSLSLFFNGTTTTSAGFATFSRNIEASVIERIEVELNGNLVSSGCNWLNHLYQALYDVTCGQDGTNRRSILQNAAKGVIPTANVNGQQFCIQQFLGFISSASPSILDTTLIGNCRIRITLTNPNALVQSAGCTGAAFSLSNIFFTCDVCSIDDGVFRDIHDKFLASNHTYEIPFYNWSSFSSSANGLSQTTKFSLSSQSLNRVIGIPTIGAYAPICTSNPTVAGITTTNASSVGSTLDPNTCASTYFTKLTPGTGGTAITWGTPANSTVVTYTGTGYQFNVNGVYCPNYMPTFEQAYANVITSFGLSDSLDGGGNPLLNSLAAWTSGFGYVECRFDSGEGVSVISGMNTQGNTASGSFVTTGTVVNGTVTGSGAANLPSNILFLVFTQCTSSLIVGSGRQLQVVL